MRRVLAVGSVLWALACAGSDGATDSPEPEPVATGDSFDTARSIAIDDATGALVLLESGEQVDYFQFEGIEGQWMVLSTADGPFSPDAVISLYDADGRRLAENDDGSIWPRDAFDARLVTRLPSTGRYFVTVEDRTTPAEVITTFPQLYYRLTIFRLTEQTPSVQFEGEEPEQLQLRALDTEFGSVRTTTILGTFSDAADVDRYGFELESARALMVSMRTAGPAGSGSTASAGEVWVRRTDDDALVARIEPVNGQVVLMPALDAGRYDLSVQHEGTAAGPNDFYSVDVAFFEDNPAEQDDAANDSMTSPDPLLDGDSRAFVLSQLPPGDVDHFSLAVPEGLAAKVLCSSRSQGSGVVGLTARVLDLEGNPLGTATETAQQRLTIDAALGPPGGEALLELSSSAQLPELVGTWVRCGVFLIRP